MWRTLGLLVVLLAGCGSATTTLPPTPTASPATTITLSIVQTGSRTAVVDPSSVRLRTDAGGGVAIDATVTAPARRAVGLRASLFDPQGALIGDAALPTVLLQASTPTTVTLNGPSPLGTVARVVFEAVPAT